MDTTKIGKKNRQVDKTMKGVFLISAIFSILAVVMICLFILLESIPAFKSIGFFNFIFGKEWSPSLNKFGILPMIISTVLVSLGAVLIGGIIGVFASIYISKFAPKKIKYILTQLVNLLAGIPSIIYGFFGMIALVPFLKNISNIGVGEGLLASSLILGIMILPTVISISKTSIDAVPKSYYDGSVALGNTHAQAIFNVVVPSAKSGILTSIVLGLGRAIGETMAVIMVAGNAPYSPNGLFGYIRTLTSNIVMEMGYSTGIHKNALIATGFILLLFILILNTLFNQLKTAKFDFIKGKKIIKTSDNIKREYIYKSRTGMSKTLQAMSLVSSALTVAILIFIALFILIKGIPNISMNFLFGKSGNSQMTLFPAIVTTFSLIVITLLIAVPIGIFASIYLVEYTKPNSAFVKIIRTFTETLSGIPSIVFGLFGMIFFCGVLKLGYSILAGSLTLVLIVLPTIIRSTEEALLSVPTSLREGSLALGSSKTRTIFKVVLPSALSGIMTSVVLSIGRIVGESAALIYTAGAVPYMPSGIMSQGSSFAVMMWMFANEGLYIKEAYATASVLLVIVCGLNIIAELVGKKYRKEIN